MRKRILSLICVFLFMAPLVPAPARAESYTSPSTYWSWLGSLNPILQKLLGHAAVSSNGISYLRLGVCPDSDDSRQIPGLLDTGYYECVCSECGQLFRAYEQDLQEAYEKYVSEELPFQTLKSDGSFVWYPDLSGYHYYTTGISNFSSSGVNPVSVHFTAASSGYFVSVGCCDECFSGFYANNAIFSSVSNHAPVDGYYYGHYSWRSEPSIYSPDMRVVGKSTYYNAGDHLSTWGNFNVRSSGSHYLNLSVWFDIVPLSAESVQFENNYNKTTRPTAISGAYGVIDGDGNIQRVESTSIINEDDHTVYNPVTNTTHGITDWTYNYDNRSYDITADDGSTLTVTYGNDNVTIVEPGGTYNVYYLSEQSDPTPTPAHDHNYTSAVTREPTCTLAGIRTYTCSECDATYTESIPATGYAWGVKQQVQTQYDDTGQMIQQGYTIYRCSICGEEYKSVDGATPPNDTNTSGGSGGQTDDGEESGGILGKIGKLLGTAASIPLKIIEGALGKILDGLISLAETIGDKLSGLVEMILGWFDVIPTLFGGFLDFLGVLFGFLPEEMITLLSFGLAAVVFVGIIKAVRR